MATLYTDVYTIFTRKVSDYSFVTLSQTDLEKILKGYLDTSVAKIKKFFKIDISDRNTTQFNISLNDIEQEILVAQMIVEWLSPVVLASEKLQQVMTDRDFKIYSQSNHLNELITLRKNSQEEADDLIKIYSYDTTGLGELR